MRATATSYARAIERALSSARGAPVVVSERDFELITRWHARGVPLAVVLEALRTARAKGRVPRSLGYVASAVEESWRHVSDGRAAAPSSGPRSEAPSRRSLSAAEQAWRARRDAEPAGSPLRGAIEEGLGRLARGEAPAAVDADLDARLPRVTPVGILAPCEAAVERALARHRLRMAPAVLERTRRLAIADRLRDTLRLPRLAPRR